MNDLPLHSLHRNQEKLVSLLTQSMQTWLQKLKASDFNETINGLVFYSSSLYEGVSIAASTIESIAESIKESPSLTPTTIESSACEWKYIGLHYELFDDPSELISRILGEAEERQIDIDETMDFFIEIFVDVFQTLKIEGFFKDPIFSKSILLGLQFPDPTNADRRLSTKIAKRVNTPEITQKYYCKTNI